MRNASHAQLLMKHFWLDDDRWCRMIHDVKWKGKSFKFPHLHLPATNPPKLMDVWIRFFEHQDENDGVNCKNTRLPQSLLNRTFWMFKKKLPILIWEKLGKLLIIIHHPLHIGFCNINTLIINFIELSNANKTWNICRTSRIEAMWVLRFFNYVQQQMPG